MIKPLAVATALLLTLVVPFLLRPRDVAFQGKPDGKVVVITPHHVTICSEFGRAFSQHMLETTGKRIVVDWRIPGGTSEIAKLVNSDYFAAFRNHWENTLGREWTREVERAFRDASIDLSGDPVTRTVAQEARAAFLSADIGIGVDLFFGGGVYDFSRQAKLGQLVARDSTTGRFGLAPLAAEHPEWFTDEVVPAEVSGEIFRDPEWRWCGSCLSAFGIVFNKETLDRLGFDDRPSRWDELGSPLLEGQIAIADPTKSGSVTKAFEMMIQQKIHSAVASIRPDPELTTAELEARAVRDGWIEGLKLIQRIGANARYFTDDATKIPRDVAAGVSAAGMCIDFYGRTQDEAVRRSDGSSRVGFLTPVGGSSVSVDPIGMFRGAPHPELAHAFLAFVLSEEGQKLWNYRTGTPGGPTKSALRRMPVRRDLYSPEHLKHFADPDVLPYETADTFVYVPAYTVKTFNALRVIIRAMCLDTHDELRRAWDALIEAGFPPRATETFQDTRLVHYDAALGRINSVINSNDKLLEVRLARDLADTFRRNYETAVAMAERGE